MGIKSLGYQGDETHFTNNSYLRKEKIITIRMQEDFQNAVANDRINQRTTRKQRLSQIPQENVSHKIGVNTLFRRSEKLRTYHHQCSVLGGW